MNGIDATRRLPGYRGTILRRALKFLTLSIPWMVCILFLSRSTHAGDRGLIEGNDVSIAYEAPLQAAARDIAENFDRTKKEVETTLGWNLESKPAILLIADSALFEKMAGGRFASAFAVPSEHTIAMHLSPGDYRPYVAHETLEHEICHLVLHEHIPLKTLPKWLDEGTCQWVSGSFGEVMTGHAGVGSEDARLSGRIIALHDLVVAFPTKEEALFQAYEESKSFMEFIGLRYGKEGIIRILRLLAEGERVEGAFSKGLGEPLENVEQKWREGLGGRQIWLIWVSTYMEEILFTVCGLLAVLGFLKSIVRMRKYPDADGEDENFPH